MLIKRNIEINYQSFVPNTMLIFHFTLPINLWIDWDRMSVIILQRGKLRLEDTRNVSWGSDSRAWATYIIQGWYIRFGQSEGELTSPSPNHSWDAAEGRWGKGRPEAEKQVKKQFQYTSSSQWMMWEVYWQKITN